MIVKKKKSIFLNKKFNNDNQIEKGPLRKICEFLKGIESFSILGFAYFGIEWS